MDASHRLAKYTVALKPEVASKVKHISVDTGIPMKDLLPQLVEYALDKGFIGLPKIMKKGNKSSG